ncbi:hypothetical protein [Actinokineospora sp. NBRC 105648]|uniref:hypothetical protein n=1 Tax=Actinokineospora sp. NBRC 105648 TaxID=3032206 RepID=UPI0024A27752|nr:hypothetical protein [Actinokineospora sp. NBRC 105648]GLZ41118.1 hypothetical protein Acsp05_47420 [Actinokineospora sp. NBRC 105648]
MTTCTKALTAPTRTVLWFLALRRVSTGRVVRHTAILFTDRGLPLPGYFREPLSELLRAGLITDTPPLQLTSDGVALLELLRRRQP